MPVSDSIPDFCEDCDRCAVNSLYKQRQCKHGFKCIRIKPGKVDVLNNQHRFCPGFSEHDLMCPDPILKRATQYLRESQLTVAEIAYKLGFNNPKYFSKYFKEEFGISPSEYQSREGV